MKLSKWIEKKRNDHKYGEYPAYDYINIGLRLMLKTFDYNHTTDTQRLALDEFSRTILAGNGYFYKDVAIGLAKCGVNVPIEKIHGVSVKDLDE